MHYIAWIKFFGRRHQVFVISYLLIGLLCFVVLNSQNKVDKFWTNFLSRQSIYPSFSLLVSKNAQTQQYMDKIKSWPGVIAINSIDAKQSIKQMDHDLKELYISLPDIFMEESIALYSIKLDRKLSNDQLLSLRKNVLDSLSFLTPSASRVRFPPELKEDPWWINYSLQWGTETLSALMILIHVMMNVLFFKKLVLDGHILSSIHREKMIPIKLFSFYSIFLLIISLVFLSLWAQLHLSLLILGIWLVATLLFGSVLHAMYAPKRIL